jgi:hypothetical protein
MRPPVQLTPGDHVNAGGLLFQNRGLHCPKLRVIEIAG